MRNYESLYIVHPDIVGDELNTLVSKFEKILCDQQAEIFKLDNWGTRKLAYPIKKVGRGTYVQVLFTAGPEVVAEYERRLRIDEQILRFLTVRVDKDFVVEAAEPAVKTAPLSDDDSDADDEEE
ncbi:MAG: 30S ribosomal protein S6 [Pelovirga sp.]